MKSSLPLITGFIIISQSILSVSAAVPTSPPTGGIDGGRFSQYFTNMIQATPCSSGNVLTGFTTTAWVNYGVRICTSVKSLLASIYGSSPAPANTVFDGFDSNGDIRWSPTTWMKSGNNVYYNAGNIGIGTSNPTAKLEVNGKIKMTSQTTILDSSDTLTTKAYVDAKAVMNYYNLPVGMYAGHCTERRWNSNLNDAINAVAPSYIVGRDCRCPAGFQKITLNSSTSWAMWMYVTSTGFACMKI